MLPSVLPTWVLVRFLPVWGPGLPLLARQFLELAAGSCLFLVVYVLLARRFAPDFLTVLFEPVLRRLRRRTTRA